MDEISRPARALMWLMIAGVLAVLYVPMAPPLILSFTGGPPGAPAFAAYAELWRTPMIVGSLWTTLAVGVLVAALATVLGLLAAMAIRELGAPRLILLAMLLPLFIPGISMGLASALLFRILGIPPSLATIVIVQTLWALPFATLIILTVMATFDPAWLEAAWMAGANRWQAFRDVEFPLIRAGLGGAASFAFILSINETVRTAAVQGRYNTVPTYIWSTYKQVGLSPVLYALMGVVIAASAAVVIAYLAASRRDGDSRS
jgi:ABC-type spermidine/putrescine transport system permease subunit II